MKSDPAYLPAGVSAIAGALCPELRVAFTLDRLCSLAGEEHLGNQIGLPEYHEFVVY